MKKIASLTVFFLILAINNGICGKPFLGTLVYSVSIEGLDTNIYQVELPDQYEISFDKDNIRFKIMMDEGQVIQDILTIGSENNSYLISYDEKKAYRMDNSALDSLSNNPVNLNKREEINGYDCNLYELVVSEATFTLHQTYWISDAINIYHPAGNSSGIGGLFVNGIPGVSIKTVSVIGQSGISYTMTFTLEEVRKGKLETGVFLIPEGFIVEEYQEEMY
jgi:hypothetical protein